MRNQGAAQPDQDDETYHAIIIFVNEILQANILASAHSGMKLSVSHKNLARLRDAPTALAIFPQTAQNSGFRRNKTTIQMRHRRQLEKTKIRAELEKQKLLQSSAVISSSSARVLRAAPHIFFTSSKDVAAVHDCLSAITLRTHRKH